MQQGPARRGGESSQRSSTPRRSARVLGWVLAVVASFVVWQQASGKVVERVVAVVNDRIILLSDLEERTAPLLPRLQQIPDPQARKQELAKLQRKMLDHMIDEDLIEQEARRLKLTIEDQDLERAVADVMRKNKLTREQLQQALAQEGKTLTFYKHNILRPQLLRLRVLNVQVRSRVSIDDEEVRALYQKNLRDLGVETKVRARHIFVALPATASTGEVLARRQHAVALMKRARADGGKGFADLAQKHSEDSVTRPDGGDLGYFPRGTLPANVEREVFAMKVGEIRGPLRTERGFHIIQLVDRKETSARSLEEVKEELHEQLYSEKMEKATRAWLDEVRGRAYIDIKI